MAYNLQAAKNNQDIIKEEVNIDVVERRKLVEVENNEIIRWGWLNKCPASVIIPTIP